MIDRDVLEALAKHAVAHGDDNSPVCLYDLWDVIDETSDEDLIALIQAVDPALLVASLP